MKQNKEDTLMYICVIAILIGAGLLFWLLLLFKMLVIPSLLILSVLSYFVARRKLPFISAVKEVNAGIFAITCIIGFIFMIKKREQVEFYSQSLIDGKYKNVRLTVVPDEGLSYDETIRAYIPRTAKGKKTMKVIEWSLIFIVATSVYVTFRMIPRTTDTDKSTRQPKA